MAAHCRGDQPAQPEAISVVEQHPRTPLLLSSSRLNAFFVPRLGPHAVAAVPLSIAWLGVYLSTDV